MKIAELVITFDLVWILEKIKIYIINSFIKIYVDNRDVFKIINEITEKSRYYTKDTSNIAKEIKRVITESLFSLK